ncbi:MAG: transcriptional activator [Rhizobium sp.]|nr:transcriptional activator [Rhizobium sp.]
MGLYRSSAWQLPPLPAIRVFEAAARLLNFTRAAEELGMTQAAVSYQIKLLEERVGTPLFIRRGRQVILTETGAALAVQTTKAFSLLSEAYQSARGGAAGQLSITTMQTFASNWLSERLGLFQQAHPDIIVTLDTSSRMVDLTKEDIDIGIRVGTGEWPGLTAHFLFKGDYTPMLSPRLAESVGGIREPADLYKVPLLGHTDPWWPAWFKAAGSEFRPDLVQPGPTLGSQFYESVSTIAGQGVAILTRNLYHSHLADGRLIQPFKTMGTDDHSYWLAYATSRRNMPKIRLFRDWMLEQTKGLRAEG